MTILCPHVTYTHTGQCLAVDNLQLVQYLFFTIQGHGWCCRHHRTSNLNDV